MKMTSFIGDRGITLKFHIDDFSSCQVPRQLTRGVSARVIIASSWKLRVSIWYIWSATRQLNSHPLAYF